MRVTDEKIIKIVENVLIDFNNDIVNSLKKIGSEAISINTQKNNLAYQNIVKKWLPKDLYPLFNQQYKQFLGQ